MNGGMAGQAKRCLIVDDSRMIRKVERRIAESLGYSVSEAENGEEALAKCKASMPQLILLDWDMPVMSGIEFVAELRRIECDNRPKVVFCTNNSNALDYEQAIAAGADDYVIKPFEPKNFLARLQFITASGGNRQG